MKQASLLYLLLFLASISLEAAPQSLLGSNIRFGTFYESNTFYSDMAREADFVFSVQPELFYLKQVNKKYSIQSESNFSYSKFLSNSNQDYFDYDVNLKNSFRFSPKFLMSLTPRAKLLSEPALAKTEERLERQYMGAMMGLVLAMDSRRQYILDVSYDQEKMSQSEYQHLDNTQLSSRLYYKKYFLPETFVYFGARGDVRSFPNGAKSTVVRKKYDSQRIEPGFGLEGRLTRYFKIRSYFGYSIISYKADVNYSDPVYLLELEEEISPKDFILTGLESSVEDSYFTNFQVNQKIYIGYGRFIGDQVLWVTKAEYLYKTYSRPQRRDDQRFIIDTRFEYSYSQDLKIEFFATFDTLSSDAVDPDGPPTPIDPSASYQSIKAGFFGKYLF
jgi:hypothetical protein